MTSINMAQVMVAGDEGGSLTWYISQPPQKTFSILFTDSKHSPAPVVSLQVGWLSILIKTLCHAEGGICGEVPM